MPRRSNREKFINELHLQFQGAILSSFVIPLLCSDSSNEDSDEEDGRRYAIAAKAAAYSAMEDSRYIFRTAIYRPDVRCAGVLGDAVPRWKSIIKGDIYNDAEFLKFFRIPRPMFLAFARIIKGHPVFNNNDSVKQRKHYSHKLHLLVTLKYFGSQGNACSAINVKDGLGIGKGSVANYVNRTVAAILSLQSRSIFWPDAVEREEISGRIKLDYLFPKCVGTVDGTHLGLAMKPSLHGEEYFTRKARYAVVAMVVNDDKRRIRYLNVGWPASVHDQRVWKNSVVDMNPQQFFSPGEYLLGDSAFSNTATLVPAYKRLGNQGELLSDQAGFNTCLAGVRVKSEHTIGIWKGRFPWLRTIPIRIANKRSMKRLIRYVRATAILHNFFVQHPTPTAWIEEEDRDNRFLDELDYITPEMTRVDGEQGGRREQIHNFLRELVAF